MNDIEAGGRPMRDLGRLAVVLLARPLAAYLNRGERSERLLVTPDGIREDVRERPTRLDDAIGAIGHRMLVWLALLFGSTFGFVLVAVARTLFGPGFRPLLVPMVAVLVFFATLSGTLLLLAAARWFVAMVIGYRGFPPRTHKLGNKKRDQRERRRREAIARQGGPSRAIRWMCTPSPVDDVVGLLVAVVITSVNVANMT